MKTFKQLKESISIVNGKIEHKCVIDTNIINNLVKYAQQVSASFQPDLRILVNQIEDELNKFGLTLGDIDLDMPFEDEGEDDYIVYMNATNNPVRNIFLSLSWRTIQGQQYDTRPDGSKLNHDVHLTVNLIDPEDMEDLLDGRDDNDDVAFVHVSEDGELNLNEEQLDEISKGLLKNYVKKASKDLAVTSQLQGAELERRNSANNEYEYKRANKNAEDFAKIRARREKGINKAASKLTEASDGVDTIKINVPAFIRCLEHAMEDVKEDAELHEFVENLIKLSKSKDILDMDDYEKAVEEHDQEEKDEMNEQSNTYVRRNINTIGDHEKYVTSRSPSGGVHVLHRIDEPDDHKKADDWYGKGKYSIMTGKQLKATKKLSHTTNIWDIHSKYLKGDQMKSFKEFLNESADKPKWRKVHDKWHTYTITSFEDRLDDIKNNKPKRDELHIDVSQSKYDPRDWHISHRSDHTLQPDKNNLSTESGIRNAKKYANKVIDFHKTHHRLPSKYEVSIYD